ncbi:TrbI/VirB10 family protein [Photobacterium damselae]|uniref:TrbI/VirB10 family protein n=1 Tax=Photobacterium damselae TaxID=38293 RepID=UPI0002B61C76|nr:TrbI/VirB10 family protein [Photobacterium damselae]AGE91749.1 TrbI [Photobacterium damselae subsp. piscicida DI21]TLS70601.1 hypothetical protein FD718_06295 [Photobacterium damselae subsp. damselae]
MSQDNSPNGMVIKPDPQTGFLGGGISKKVKAVATLLFVSILMIMLYVISQKGKTPPPTEVESPTPTHSKNNSQGSTYGLKDLLNSAPDSPIANTTNKDTGTQATNTPNSPPDPNLSNTKEDGHVSDIERQRLMELEKELMRIKQFKAQQLQEALTATTSIQYDKSNDTGNTNSASGSDPLAQYKLMQSQATQNASTIQNANVSDQDTKLAFLEKDRTNTYLHATRETPLSPYELSIGTLIPAAMIGGINSDLPGQIVATITQNVYDSATGSHLLIPQGSQLVGVYDSKIAYGQQRVLSALTRINFPDGSRLDLGGMNAIDTQGYSGLEDQVDNHYFKIFGNAFLLGVVTGFSGAGVSDGNENNTSTAESINNGITQQFAQTGSSLIEKNLDVQPTIKIRNGMKFNVMLTKDIILKPYTNH